MAPRPWTEGAKRYNAFLALHALRAIEWQPFGHRSSCPDCHGWEPDGQEDALSGPSGHLETCGVARVIRLLEHVLRPAQ